MSAIAVQLAGVTSVFYEDFTIGTNRDCDLILYDEHASPRHAVISADAGGWWIEDMGSTRGVRVNGELRATMSLARGDRIRLGRTEIIVVPT